MRHYTGKVSAISFWRPGFPDHQALRHRLRCFGPPDGGNAHPSSLVLWAAPEQGNGLNRDVPPDAHGDLQHGIGSCVLDVLLQIPEDSCRFSPCLCRFVYSAPVVLDLRQQTHCVPNNPRCRAGVMKIVFVN
jgi:hypothetical protein